MLVTMLGADLAELEGIGPSPLAKHIRACSKCSAVAERLLTETLALARAAESRPALDLDTMRARRSRRIVVGAGLTSIAASLLIGLFVEYSLNARIQFEPTVRENVSLPRTALELTSDRADTITARIAAALDGSVPERRSIEPVAVAAIRFADAEPVTAVQFSPSAVRFTPVAVQYTPEAVQFADPAVASTSLVQVDAAVVSVDPPEGTRVTVVRGRNPAITVVWLY